MLEGSPDMAVESEKEWYYGNKEKERLGPFSFVEVRVIRSVGRSMSQSVSRLVSQSAVSNTLSHSVTE